MTTEGIAMIDATADEGRLFCYRHPDRETYVSCGRCDRPICPRCAMQGPVGFRCRDCGKPAFDPMSSLTPAQLAIGGGLALGGGVVSGLAGAIGFLGLCVALFVGGAAAEAIRRSIGYKQGPLLWALVFGGLAVGALVGYGLIYGGSFTPAVTDGVDQAAVDAAIAQTAGWAVLIGGVACFGAYSRLR